MVAKKKTKKKQQTKSKRTTASKIMPKRKSAKNKPIVRTGTAKKGLAKKKFAKKKAVLNAKSDSRRVIGAKTVSEPTKRARPKSENVPRVALPPEGRGARSGVQSGDLQGLSGAEGPDSESVDELLEEGNAFEAGVVAGVEDAGNADEREVRTREVPEDDVPEEYLDKE